MFGFTKRGKAEQKAAELVVGLYRALCALTVHHRRHYHENAHGGRPMLRSCIYCGKRQTWNYGLARERGVIEWVSLPRRPR